MFDMKKINIGLNGFGRIGRAFTRIALSQGNINIKAINTAKSDSKILSYLLKYDSVYRTFPQDIHSKENQIIINDQAINCYNFKTPEEIPFEKDEVDIVIDCTGKFEKKEDLQKHLKGSVKKVILTAPAKDDLPHIVLGVNDANFDFTNNNIISNASCTTNCAAPMFKVINDNLKIVSGLLTTAHAYTATQELLDNASKEPTRSRAAALSIIPSTTGAAKTVGKIIPELYGKVDGVSLRVPVPTGSITDITCLVENKTSVEEINKMFKNASETSMKNILKYEEEELVSSDYIGSSYSCIFDANYTKVINENFIKIFGWYDNEWGYSTRLIDLVNKISNFI